MTCEALREVLKHTPFEDLYRAAFEATCDRWNYLEGRTHRLARILRNVLETDALTAEQRSLVFKGLYGKRGDSRDATKILSDVELRMLKEYRDMDNAGRQMLRTLFARLASSGQWRSPMTDAPSGDGPTLRLVKGNISDLESCSPCPEGNRLMADLRLLAVHRPIALAALAEMAARLARPVREAIEKGGGS